MVETRKFFGSPVKLQNGVCRSIAFRYRYVSQGNESVPTDSSKAHDSGSNTKTDMKMDSVNNSHCLGKTDGFTDDSNYYNKSKDCVGGGDNDDDDEEDTIDDSIGLNPQKIDEEEIDRVNEDGGESLAYETLDDGSASQQKSEKKEASTEKIPNEQEVKEKAERDAKRHEKVDQDVKNEGSESFKISVVEDMMTVEKFDVSEKSLESSKLPESNQETLSKRDSLKDQEETVAMNKSKEMLSESNNKITMEPQEEIEINSKSAGESTVELTGSEKSNDLNYCRVNKTDDEVYPVIEEEVKHDPSSESKTDMEEGTDNSKNQNDIEIAKQVVQSVIEESFSTTTITDTLTTPSTSTNTTQVDDQENDVSFSESQNSPSNTLPLKERTAVQDEVIKTNKNLIENNEFETSTKMDTVEITNRVEKEDDLRGSSYSTDNGDETVKATFSIATNDNAKETKDLKYDQKTTGHVEDKKANVSDTKMKVDMETEVATSNETEAINSASKMQTKEFSQDTVPNISNSMPSENNDESTHITTIENTISQQSEEKYTKAKPEITFSKEYENQTNKQVIESTTESGDDSNTDSEVKAEKEILMITERQSDLEADTNESNMETAHSEASFQSEAVTPEVTSEVKVISSEMESKSEEACSGIKSLTFERTFETKVSTPEMQSQTEMVSPEIKFETESSAPLVNPDTGAAAQNVKDPRKAVHHEPKSETEAVSHENKYRTEAAVLEHKSETPGVKSQAEEVDSEVKSETEVITPEIKSKTEEVIPKEISETGTFTPEIKSDAGKVTSEIISENDAVIPKSVSETETATPEIKSEPEIVTPGIKSEPETVIPGSKSEIEGVTLTRKSETDIAHPEVKPETEAVTPEIKSDAGKVTSGIISENDAVIPKSVSETETATLEIKSEPETVIPGIKSEPETVIPGSKSEIEGVTLTSKSKTDIVLPEVKLETEAVTPEVKTEEIAVSPNVKSKTEVVTPGVECEVKHETKLVASEVKPECEIVPSEAKSDKEALISEDKSESETIIHDIKSGTEAVITEIISVPTEKVTPELKSQFTDENTSGFKSEANDVITTEAKPEIKSDICEIKIESATFSLEEKFQTEVLLEKDKSPTEYINPDMKSQSEAVTPEVRPVIAQFISSHETKVLDNDASSETNDGKAVTVIHSEETKQDGNFDESSSVREDSPLRSDSRMVTEIEEEECLLGDGACEDLGEASSREASMVEPSKGMDMDIAEAELKKGLRADDTDDDGLDDNDFIDDSGKDIGDKNEDISANEIVSITFSSDRTVVSETRSALSSSKENCMIEEGPEEKESTSFDDRNDPVLKVEGSIAKTVTEEVSNSFFRKNESRLEEKMDDIETGVAQAQENVKSSGVVKEIKSMAITSETSTVMSQPESSMDVDTEESFSPQNPSKQADTENIIKKENSDSLLDNKSSQSFGLNEGAVEVVSVSKNETVIEDFSKSHVHDMKTDHEGPPSTISKGEVEPQAKHDDEMVATSVDSNTKLSNYAFENIRSGEMEGISSETISATKTRTDNEKFDVMSSNEHSVKSSKSLDQGDVETVFHKETKFAKTTISSQSTTSSATNSIKKRTDEKSTTLHQEGSRIESSSTLNDVRIMGGLAVESSIVEEKRVIKNGDVKEVHRVDFSETKLEKSKDTSFEVLPTSSSEVQNEVSKVSPTTTTQVVNGQSKDEENITLSQKEKSENNLNMNVI